MAQSAEQVTDLGRGHRPAAKTVNPPSLQHNASDLMKILFHPASGRWGNSVAYQSRYGQALRNYCVPRNGRTLAQQRMREVFGRNSRTWSRGLSEEQRDCWNLAGPQVMSHPRCGQRGPLTGAQFFEGINSVLGCVGLPPLWEPPARVLFGLSPVRQLVITNDERGVRLFLNLAAPPTEDIMVFGQAPCKAGRTKRRNVSYLGLLPPLMDGLSDITDLYKAKYGEPRLRTKIFIVTCQQKNGWQGFDQQTSAVVPDRPEALQATLRPECAQNPYMHKGSTRGAQGTIAPPVGLPQGSSDTGDAGVKAAGAALERGAVPDEEGDAPV